ncbi:MAG: hypothetical protein Q9225_000741 [Loekoesia sp. 1 TL-2023]
MNQDGQRLLSPDKEEAFSENENENDAGSYIPTTNNHQRHITRFIILQIILVGLYTLISAVVSGIHIRNALAVRYMLILFHEAPIQGLAIEYAPMIFHNLKNNPYVRTPNKTVDSAWDALMAPMHIRVTAKELERDNQASVHLTEGGGYLGWLGVFHELHCLNLLRRWHYRGYYYSDVTGAKEEQHMLSHVGKN